MQYFLQSIWIVNYFDIFDYTVECIFLRGERANERKRNKGMNDENHLIYYLVCLHLVLLIVEPSNKYTSSEGRQKYEVNK